MLIKPFQATVAMAGSTTYAIAIIRHDLAGITWKVYQIGFGLGQNAPSPQVAAHVNGVPLAATVTMQSSVFANIPGQSPYAMESFFVGPPYMILSAGDQLVCAVLGANVGDTFTAAAYIEEKSALANLSMGS
jgi:hypothetical protein